MSARNFYHNLKRLWSYSLEEDYEEHYVRWEDHASAVISHAARITALQGDIVRLNSLGQGSSVQNVLAERIMDVQSSLDKHRVLIGLIIKDLKPHDGT
jgi:hypothetical protein